MTEVWKFPIDVTDVWTPMMPPGAKPLHVATQGEVPTLWALVTPCDPTEFEMVRFRIVGTGHELELSHGVPSFFDVGEHVGTFLLFGGGFVGHVFAEASPF